MRLGIKNELSFCSALGFHYHCFSNEDRMRLGNYYQVITQQTLYKER